MPLYVASLKPFFHDVTQGKPDRNKEGQWFESLQPHAFS